MAGTFAKGRCAPRTDPRPLPAGSPNPSMETLSLPSGFLASRLFGCRSGLVPDYSDRFAKGQGDQKLRA
jgi:hypothetical protein